jgi:serine/threonine-protein kinase
VADNSRVEQLLDELYDSQATPEDVCSSCPELLPEVRERLWKIRRVEAAVDALFPKSSEPGAVGPTPGHEAATLPRIPGYEVEAVLGHGGMGVVFRARHLRLGRTVALKMALADVYAGPHERARFQREAEAAAALRHPNVVQIHDVGDSDGRPYFTMEYVEGGNLAQKLAGTPQPARQAAALLATLARAVHAAHQGGIVHRDLKPGNVLLTAPVSGAEALEGTRTRSSLGTPKISDFGLARRLDGEAGLTRTGTALGTPSYMAPEQARSQTDGVGPAADVYALGAILYECLTGRPPFRAETAAETVLQVIHQDPVAPSRLNARVPRDLETICLKCLRKEPQLRYVSAAALAEDLERFLRGEPVAARPEGRFERLARRVRRRPVRSLALAAGTLILVGLVAGGLWLLSERAAAARAMKAERVAVRAAAAEDLRDMVGCLKKSSWPEARAALERARGRLGESGSADLRRLLDQGACDLELAARLEAIRLNRARGIRVFLVGPIDEQYDEAFHEAGLGRAGDAPQVVAGRVRASHIQGALVAALDHWSAYAANPRRRSWVLDVARRADPDPAGWRDRARDPAVRADEAALVKVIKAAPVADSCVPLLLALDRHLDPHSKERLPFLKKIQQAHADDFWANFTLGNVLQWENPGEAVRYYQAAVALRPHMALTYHNLGLALFSTGRLEEAIVHFRKAVDLDPTSLQTHHVLALVLAQLGRHDEAIEQLRTAIRFNPNEAGLHAGLGQRLEAAGRPVEALPHYRRAVALNPNDKHIQKGLRSLQVRLGQASETLIAPHPGDR